MKKYGSWIVAVGSFIGGCVTGTSGVLDGLVKIPVSYNQLKVNYLYDSEFLKGEWSTNSEYVANSKDLGLDIAQPVIVMNMEADKDGSINGEIMSEKICDALPLTWYINFESKSPSIINFITGREFEVTQLHNGETETVATMKLINKNKKFGAITFEVTKDLTGSLPKMITFGKGLPQYKSDYKHLQDYCGDSPRKYFSQQLGKEIPKKPKKD